MLQNSNRSNIIFAQASETIDTISFTTSVYVFLTQISELKIANYSSIGLPLYSSMHLFWKRVWDSKRFPFPAAKTKAFINQYVPSQI